MALQDDGLSAVCHKDCRVLALRELAMVLRRKINMLQCRVGVLPVVDFPCDSSAKSSLSLSLCCSLFSACIRIGFEYFQTRLC